MGTWNVSPHTTVSCLVGYIHPFGGSAPSPEEWVQFILGLNSHTGHPGPRHLLLAAFPANPSPAHHALLLQLLPPADTLTLRDLGERLGD